MYDLIKKSGFDGVRYGDAIVGRKFRQAQVSRNKVRTIASQDAAVMIQRVSRGQ